MTGLLQLKDVFRQQFINICYMYPQHSLLQILHYYFKKLILFSKDSQRVSDIENDEIYSKIHPYIKEMSFEQRFKEIFFNKFTTIIILKISNTQMDKISYINDNCLHLLQYQKHEAIGQSVNALLPPNFRNNHTNLMKKVTQTGITLYPT